MRYQFLQAAPHCTPGCGHASTLTWKDSRVILLGTIDQELLVEYVRGPPFVMELHDRDRKLPKENNPSVFGKEERDEVLGTHAFSSGELVLSLRHVHASARGHSESCACMCGLLWCGMPYA